MITARIPFLFFEALPRDTVAIFVFFFSVFFFFAIRFTRRTSSSELLPEDESYAKKTVVQYIKLN